MITNYRGIKMPVIVLGATKGGAGKTTTSVLAACEIARQAEAKGLSVGIVDADPHQHSAGWAKLPGCPENINIYGNATEENIIDKIEQAKQKNLFVFVDLEGVSSLSMNYAVGLADHVIIPCQPSQNDANEAAKTIKLIKNSSRMVNRNIPFSILFTRVGAAIVTKTARHLADEFRSAGVNVFSTALIERELYRSIFSFGGTIYSSKSKEESKIKAIKNINAVVSELKKALIKENKEEVVCE